MQLNGNEEMIEASDKFIHLPIITECPLIECIRRMAELILNSILFTKHIELLINILIKLVNGAFAVL